MTEPQPQAGPRIKRLSLTQFRNHTSTRLDFDAGTVAFTGPNGAGKTNVLEALSLLSPGRGLRRSKYADMVKSNADQGFAVTAHLVPADHAPEDDPVILGSGVSDRDASGRDIRINKVPAKSADALLEYCSVLWLTPAMDGLFTGGASDRRRFFDRMVMALHPTHGRMASRFESAMRQRNKMLDEGVMDSVWFDGVESQMAEAGIVLHQARVSTLSNLQAAIENARDAVSAFPFAVIDLAGFDADIDEAGYRDLLARGRQRDRAAGRTLEGPHRVDLLVRHGPKDVEAKLASTGEQKALLIGLILAQARMVKHQTGRAAFLLLDEIAAHLDSSRRAALFDLCADLGGQTFMTGTDQSLFDALGSESDHFTVEDGVVSPQR